MIKKVFVSLAVIFSFGLYAFAVRQEGKDNSGVIITPSATLTTTPPSSTPDNSPTTMPMTTMPSMPMHQVYKDGTFTSLAQDAFYGNIQIKTTITRGKITGIQFLQYPNDRENSIYINNQALPILRNEAIQVQSAQVDIVSGATDSSMAFKRALADTLGQAKN